MASVTCKKCGNEVEIPEGSRSPFITCPNCRGAIQIPRQKPVINRPASSVNSYSSYSQPQVSQKPVAETNTNMVACAMCGEPIRRGILKCPHCGEYQNAELREKAHQEAENAYSPDAVALSFLDRAVCRLSPIIGSVFGCILWFIKSPIYGGILKESLTSLSVGIISGLLNTIMGGSFSLLILVIIASFLKNELGELIKSILGFYFVFGLIILFLVFGFHMSKAGIGLLFIAVNVLSFIYLLIKTITSWRV